MTSKTKLLVLCTGNSARSQMAEGLLRYHGGDRFEVWSAGTQPSRVRAEAIAVMNEIGIDISGHRSKSVEEFVGQDVDVVITVCDRAQEICPIFPGTVTRLHWPFDDPAAVAGSDEIRHAAFRRIRDQIHSRIMVFLNGDASAV
jgi:arsenate reductase